MPGREEDVADTGMNGDGSSILDSGPERFPVPAVLELRDVHVLRVPVHPVELVVDPVDGQAFESVRVVIDQDVARVVGGANLGPDSKERLYLFANLMNIQLGVSSTMSIQ